MDFCDEIISFVLCYFNVLGKICIYCENNINEMHYDLLFELCILLTLDMFAFYVLFLLHLNTNSEISLKS